MERFKTIDEFEAYVRSQWDAHGACGSCGWHGLLYEHGGIDELPDEEDYKRGYYSLCCVNKDYDCGGRGVRIPLPRQAGGES